MTQPVDVLIIGAGLSGLSAAYAAHQKRQTVCVLEAGTRVGGLIETQEIGPYLTELGPHTFPNTASDILALCQALNITPHATDAGANKRYLYHHGRLHALPASPLSAFTTPLLSLRAKFRLLKEPFIPAVLDTDPSLADFFSHRVGSEVANIPLDAFISGIYAGDIHQLSAKAVFPGLWEKEQRHGSLLKGMLAKKKPEASPRKEKMKLLSLPGGLQTLTLALAHSLPRHSIWTHQTALAITQTSDGARWQVRTQTGEIFTGKSLILAVPAYVAANLLEDFLPQVTIPLRAIPYTGLASVQIGLQRKQISHMLDGFGFLAPRASGMTLLGSIWASSIYPERAPQGQVLLTNFIGGAHHPEIVGQTDDWIVQQVLSDLAIAFNTSAPLQPDFYNVCRYPNGIPQYNIGHIERIAAIESALSPFPTLALCGNYLKGIALNACVQSGQAALQRVSQSNSASVTPEFSY